MSNPFKKVLLFSEVPKGLKKKVLDDVNMIQLTMDIADLFLVKYPKTITGFFGKNSSKKK